MKIFIITLNKKALILAAFMLIFTITIVSIAFGTHTKNLKTFNNSWDEYNMLEDTHALKNLLDSLMNQKQKIIYEDDDRIIYKNGYFSPSPPLSISKLNKVINQGVEVKFKILYNEPSYLRPVYNPDWKSAYYRGWLDLPVKNMEARHKIFTFSAGGSQNYDTLGSLGYSPKSPPNAPLDNHHNINFLIHGFNVKSVKSFIDQVALIGEPKQSGVQIVSIVQDDLLPQGVDTKDFLFQLSTPGGYEIDFQRNNIIRYEYLMKIIKENTVSTFDFIKKNNKSQEKSLTLNTALKKELSYFIPLEDEIIYQQICDNSLNGQAEIDNIQSIIAQGKKINFSYNYSTPLYKRPLYDPSWKTNYKRMWHYIPKQVEYNLHRLLIIPKNNDEQKDFFGTLGFREKFQPIKPEQLGLMVYNFSVSDVMLYKDKLILVGTPARAGAQIVSINLNNLIDYEKYLVSLVTLDNSEIDCNIIKP